MPSAPRFVDGLQRQGRYCFSTEEAVVALGRSAVAVRAALRRLKAKGAIASPYRGFHVIVPPEYRDLGCLPPDQFVPDLMRHLGELYYVTLLSAASYHGAAHQRPQVFQVMLQQQRRAMACGRSLVEFASRADLEQTAVVERNTLRGTLRIASAAATAVELVGYPDRSGGINNVATVLAELAESIEPPQLAVEAERAPVAWVQRLGHLLSAVEAPALAAALDPVLGAKDPFPVALVPSAPRLGRARDSRWRVVVNADVEPEV